MGEIRKKLLIDEELKKVYEVVLTADFLNSKLNETIEKKQKTYKMDGFRVGKAPLDVIRKKEGTAMFFGVAEDMINNAAFGIADENGYELVTLPKVEVKTIKEGDDVTVSIEYALKPTIPELDLKTITVDKYEIKVQEQEVESSINDIIKNFKKWINKDGSVFVGDSVKIDFVGKIDGETFDGGVGKDYQLEIGSHSFIDNFEEQLVGKSAGDKVLVKVKFPDNYHSVKLAGKNAEFDVDIKEVLRAEIEDLTDELVNKSFGINTVSEFRDIVKREIEGSYALLAKNKERNAVIDKISGLIDFSVPNSLVEERFWAILKNKKEDNLKNKKEEEIDETELKKEAEESIRLGLFFTDIGKKQNITVSKNEVDSHIVKNAMKIKGYEQKMIDFYKKNPRAVEDLRASILEEKIIDYLVENVTRNIVETTLEEFKKLK
jgi:trigger factor